MNDPVGVEVEFDIEFDESTKLNIEIAELLGWRDFGWHPNPWGKRGEIEIVARSPELPEERTPIPDYSTDIADAFKVVEYCRTRNKYLSLVYKSCVDEPFDQFFWVAEFRSTGLLSRVQYHNSPAMAICLAALDIFSDRT